MSLDLLTHEVRPAAGPAEGALVLLHGRGADERDLFPLFDVLDPERRLFGISPGGPLSLPPGGRHWYAIRQVGYPPPDTFLPTYERLTAWLDALPGEIGVPWERTIVGGFSQGAVMSYAVAFAEGRPEPAGVLGMSGFMATVEGHALDLSERDGFPVAIAHGTMDPVIDVRWGREARDRLVEAGADVLYRESPMAHTIDPRVLPDLTGWIAGAIHRSSRPAG